MLAIQPERTLQLAQRRCATSGLDTEQSSDAWSWFREAAVTEEVTGIVGGDDVALLHDGCS